MSISLTGLTFQIFLFFTLSLLTIITAYENQFYGRQADSCNGACGNIFSAVSICPNDACLCPTVTLSAAACSSCLINVDADPTDAAIIGSAALVCQMETTGGASVFTTGSVGPSPTSGVDPCST